MKDVGTFQSNALQYNPITNQYYYYSQMRKWMSTQALRSTNINQFNSCQIVKEQYQSPVSDAFLDQQKQYSLHCWKRGQYGIQVQNSIILSAYLYIPSYKRRPGQSSKFKYVLEAQFTACSGCQCVVHVICRGDIQVDPQ